MSQELGKALESPRLSEATLSTKEVSDPMRPNEGQQAAIDAMVAFVEDRSPGAPGFFLLRGPAGTGKTFCVRELVKRVRGRVALTAPTNKATKVLRDTLAGEGFRPDCKTIYSLLGLTMSVDGEVKELASKDEKIDLTQYRYVLVDEGSMLNKQIMEQIKAAQEMSGTKFIFMLDAAQLPPVKELRSPVCDMPTGAELTKVMRHDNQILAFATKLRAQVDNVVPRISLVDDHTGDEGVFRTSKQRFMVEIMDEALDGGFSTPGQSKVIAWRNATVAAYNRTIRGHLFGEAYSNFWLPEDRIICAGPAKNLEGDPMCSTDDEGHVNTVDIVEHPLEPSFNAWRIGVTMDDNAHAVLFVLHPSSQRAYVDRTERLAAEARTDRKRWKDFWEFKELFHEVKHGYAITAHRAQGSTYEKAFVDVADILVNQNRQEAYRCLYVAATRPKKQLWLG